jgi:hypothetical protein
MSFLNVNHKEAETKTGYSVLPEGDYEVLISEVEKKQSQSGNDMLKLTLTVRTDVTQEGQKRKVWDYLVATEKAMFKFQQVAKALDFQDGVKYDTIDEFAKAILFKPVQITVKHETSEFNGKTRTNERVVSYGLASKPYSATGVSDKTPF